ncbi:MAG: hypothetical protein L3J08_02525 [Flavobacteriaceae bacterium]|nr:hypothetical protein [Flavobacteriaceae bacterium]
MNNLINSSNKRFSYKTKFLVKNKAFFIFIAFFIISLSSFSQTIIWQENFDSYANGVTNGNGTGTSTVAWSTNDGDVDIRTTTGSNRVIEGRNTDNNNAFWRTGQIDISGYGNVQFSLDVDYGGTLDHGQDRFTLQYRINSGSWITVVNASGDNSPSSPIAPSYTVSGLTGNNLRLRIRFDNTGNDEYYRIDNVLVQDVVPNTPPTLTATGDQNICPASGSSINIATAISITDPDDTTTSAIYIQVSSGYINGEDLLTLDNLATHAANGITTSWDAVQGELTLIGPALYTDFEAAILDVLYSNSSGTATGTRQFSITVGEANFLPSTTHYYEYVPNLGITWTDANAAANVRTYFGMQGYLATLTTLEEAVFSGTQALGTGWIGATDVGAEGQWRWVTGPEGIENAGSGRLFWQGVGTSGNTTAPDNFHYWRQTPGNEPNNSGNEDYAHIVHPSLSGTPGSWNDLRIAGNTNPASAYHPQGYVVEYGGMPGDPVLNITATTTLNLNCIDLSLTKIVDNTTACVGETVVFTLELTNNGPNDLPAGAIVTDLLPAGFTYISNAGSGSYNSGTGEWAIGNLLNGNSTFLNITATVNTSGPYINNAAITNNPLTDTNTANNSDNITVTVTSSPLAPTVISPVYYIIGEVASTLTATGTNLLWYTNAIGGTGSITAPTPSTTVARSTSYYVSQTNANGCEGSRAQIDVIVRSDNDNDGIPDEIDLDDDNDGIPDTEESQCEIDLSPSGSPPSSNVITNLGTRLYTDYNGYWTSAVGSINTVRPDNNSHLLAFEMGGQTYATGVSNSRFIDSDSNGLFDLLDTDGNGTGDVTLVESSWTALTPLQEINNGVRLEASLLDGNLGISSPLLTSGGAPFNPYLSQGARGLNMAYSIANIGNTWYFNIQGIQSSAYGDGVLDILLTQVALPNGSSTTNTVHLLDNTGNYIGNGVTVNWNTVNSMGNHVVDQYDVSDAPSGANQVKGMRFGGIELSEFNLTPAEISSVVALRLNISGTADPAFFAINDQSFISSCVDFDTDGDGIPNALDLDSDNDGIYDAVEAGHNQPHTNGVVNGTVGTDGIPDTVQSSPNSGGINYTIAESTGDTDTIPNYLDLDSDGDGIPDNVEAQTTVGYIAPAGAVDANGIDTNYTSGLTPTNTDGVDNPDYLDTDSDNEGGNDTVEAGITLTNTDTDSDGLDDATDATADYSDPGGTIDNPVSGSLILPDTDTDALTGGDVDFRDAQNEADLSLTKTVNNSSPNQGDNITFTLTISNAGPSSPTNIIVKDIIPTDFTYTHPNFTTTQGTVTYNVGTREFEWNLGAFVLGAGNTITLTYTVTVDVCGEFTNQAEIINSSLPDLDSTPNNGG